MYLTNQCINLPFYLFIYFIFNQNFIFQITICPRNAFWILKVEVYCSSLWFFVQVPKYKINYHCIPLYHFAYWFVGMDPALCHFILCNFILFICIFSIVYKITKGWVKETLQNYLFYFIYFLKKDTESKMIT